MIVQLDERVYEKQEAVDKQKQHAVEKLRESGQAMRAATASTPLNHLYLLLLRPALWVLFLEQWPICILKAIVPIRLLNNY